MAPKEVYPPHIRASEVKKGLRAGKYLQGDLRMSKNTCYSGSVKVGGELIRIIGSRALNRAIDGDLVVVERLDDLQMEDYEASAKRMRHGVGDQEGFSETQAIEQVLEVGDDTLTSKVRGRIVSIVERRNRIIAGTLVPPGETPERGPDAASLEEGDRVFVPPDRRFPYVIVAPPEGEDVEDKRVSVQMNQWDRFSEYPRGTWADTLGTIGDIEVETKMILLEHNIKADEFSEEVLACLPADGYRPTEKDIEGREDYRNLLVFSIDPPGCEDVDDALSVEKMENGNYKVGVHIADVTHYLKPDTAMDLEAMDRSTSVYLTDRRIDMLPRSLTTDICSLRSDGERLTFSVMFEITPDAQVRSEKFHKSVIHSKAQLSYEEAQMRLDGQIETEPEINEAVKTLNTLALKFKAARQIQGCLELASTEIGFELDDDTKLPTKLKQSESFQTCKLIEEFMLLANRSVAKRIQQFYPEYALLRNHIPPQNQDMAELRQLLKCHGVENFQWYTNKRLQRSLDEIVKPEDEFFNKLVRMMVTRCMKEAQYINAHDKDPIVYHHFGLGMKLYTHFTSPIRRYADVIVHRLLAASLNIEKLPMNIVLREQLDTQIEKLNYRTRMARWADMASMELFLFNYFKNNGPANAMGVVTRIQHTGATVAVEEFGCEGLVDMSSMDWLLLADRQTAHGRPRTKFEGLTMGIFDRVVVRVAADMRDGRHRKLRITFLGLPQKPMGISSKDKVPESVGS